MAAAQCGTFAVHSPSTCYGPLLNLYYSSQAPILSLPPQPECFVQGSRRTRHAVAPCVPAQFGSWRTYPLTDLEPPHDITGWFAAHESVDAQSELDKILRVAGSPYEYDAENTENNADTRNASVLLVDLMSWMRPDKSAAEEFPDAWAAFQEDKNVSPTAAGMQGVGYWDYIGLVDFAHAAHQVQIWSRSASAQRQSTHHAAWMHVPVRDDIPIEAAIRTEWEQAWVRIGFDDDYTQARSVLYFQGSTDFFQTAFPGETEPLRKWETELQRYERGVREGNDFSGLKEFNRHAPGQYKTRHARREMWLMPREDELLGPYPRSSHLFTLEDLEFLGERNRPRYHTALPKSMSAEQKAQWLKDNPPAQFSPHFEKEIVDLVNELVLSFLERIVPFYLWARRFLVDKILHDHETLNSLHNRIMRLLLYSHACIHNFEPFLPKVRDLFIEKTSGEIPDDADVSRLVFAATFLASEIVVECDYVAFGVHEHREEGERPIIVPKTIRQVIEGKTYIAELVFHSRVLWHGRSGDE